MTESNRVAVHIVTYNSAASIRECLQAICPQIDRDQLLIIDNASTDETTEIIANMGLPFIQNATNIGYAAAHNQAMRQTQSDYVLTLNPDVIVQPGFIPALVQVMDRHPQVGAAAGCLLRVEHPTDTPCCVDSTGLCIHRNRRQYLRGEGLPIGQRPNTLSFIFGPDGASAFYRRAMLEDIAIMGEVFDADFFIHKEDIDICWRAQLYNWTALYVPEAVAHHIRAFRPGQRHQVDMEVRFYAVRNRYLLMLKHETWTTFLRDAWAILSYDVAILVYLLLFERPSLGALRAAWVLRRRMREKHRVIQAQGRANRRLVLRWLEAR